MAKAASEETSETDEGKRRTPLTMILPPAALAAAAIAVAVLPGLGRATQTQAVRFQDQRAYSSAVLTGARAPGFAAPEPTEPAGITAADLASGLGSAAGSALLALAALYWRRLPLLRRGYEPGGGFPVVIQRFQSGVVNDYVTWLVIGLACVGGVLALSMR